MPHDDLTDEQIAFHNHTERTRAQASHAYVPRYITRKPKVNSLEFARSLKPPKAVKETEKK